MIDPMTADRAGDPPSDGPDKDGYRDGESATDTLAAVAGTDLAQLVERTRASLRDAVPANTRRAYAGDLKRFTSWCTTMGLVAMPAAPGTIALYMRMLADSGRRIATVERAVAAISASHVRSGVPSPWTSAVVGDMRAALRRELGVRPLKKRAADDDVLRKLLAVLPSTRLGLRDRALLTLGWSGAFRRSELVALNVADVTRAPKGAVVLVRLSKTDPEQRGEEIPIFFSNLAAHCPIRSLDAWLDVSGIDDGAIFRALGRSDRLGERLSPDAVAVRVQHWAKVEGLVWRDYAGHSLRSGFVTTAARRGKDVDSIMVTTRHRSERTVREYVRIRCTPPVLPRS
jgi:site-specific recombinase XerD